jgi:cellobiose-specific phosphotransferase system component IIB
MVSLLTDIKDLSVVRRMAFAATFLPESMPNYWETVAAFGLKGKESRNKITAETARLLVENWKCLDRALFDTDDELLSEFVGTSVFNSRVKMGVVLLSPQECCLLCNSKLYVRADRFSSVVIYDITYGTMPGTHFVKYCRKKGCNFNQHYGFYIAGNGVVYNNNWKTLKYFMSSNETVFSMEFLRRFDIELLVGQVSYKQQADIYNLIHGYDDVSHDR